jgi:FtsP/CotA-like multicopper oxidase with cupredoxin domain
MSTTARSTYQRPVQSESGVLAKVVAVFLGILVAVLGFFALMLWADARDARDDANAAAADAQAGAAAHEAQNVALPLNSFAGQVPENALELAEAHTPYDATMPALQAGDLVKVHMVMKDRAVEIAPGVKYNVWAFDGDYSAPGPIVHVRQGQTVEFTLTNGGAIPHSMDFHAARIAPNVAFRDVAPGESFTFRFQANDPGVFMYHCGT